MGVFEFILLIVLISTVGKVLEARGDRMAKTALPPAPDVQHLEEVMGEMSSRLARLEEERDFYRALLEPPEIPRRVPEASGEAQGPLDTERS